MPESTPEVMRRAARDAFPIHAEPELFERLLPLDGASILELGCGRAALTRLIATTGRDRRVLALEVDAIQHEKNLAIDDLPNVAFAAGGAEAIPAPDASVDVVLMFKSLHHVPPGLMSEAMREIRRVLRPGGLAYISEPVFAGDFTELLRIFHDESRVRELAFAAVERAVADGTLELVRQEFFGVPVRFADFGEFERMVIGSTHTHHHLSPEQYERVRARFARHQTPEGAKFMQPMRVDLLRRAAA